MKITNLSEASLPKIKKRNTEISVLPHGQTDLVGLCPEENTGNLNCAHINLTSLRGAPSSVGANFNCQGNKLTSLNGAPSIVGGDFYCDHNKLTSLEGAPSIVGGDFICSNNKLTSLEGAPSSVGANFNCQGNKLTSLKGVHKYIKQINGVFFIAGNPLKSHILGVLLIKGLQVVALDKKSVQNILNKYLPNTRGMEAVLECQDELIEAGFGEYAQL